MLYISQSLFHANILFLSNLFYNQKQSGYNQCTRLNVCCCSYLMICVFKYLHLTKFMATFKKIGKIFCLECGGW